ncbi:MAG: hypothetical protein H0X13_13935 [Ramlibacter sp.]|nr:hypothetical protein [Ramlibacter sp.]
MPQVQIAAKQVLERLSSRLMVLRRSSKIGCGTFPKMLNGDDSLADLYAVN